MIHSEAQLGDRFFFASSSAASCAATTKQAAKPAAESGSIEGKRDDPRFVRKFQGRWDLCSL
jgi:hypothetical protein